MTRVVLFNKPFRVMSQFRQSADKVTLAHFFTDKALRLAGRLDFESEGLLVLTDDGALVQRVTHPKFHCDKTYLAQVEGSPSCTQIDTLRDGIRLKDGMTRPARVEVVDEPEWLWARNPPIRYRAAIPTHWLKITISEGRNRQVRRMTAAAGLPTLRLIRVRVGEWRLDELSPGEHRVIIGAQGKK
jgi:23S rRNA pseudouridine2457 synthase